MSKRLAVKLTGITARAGGLKTKGEHAQQPITPGAHAYVFADAVDRISNSARHRDSGGCA